MTRAVLLPTQVLHLLGSRGSKVCVCQRRHSNSKGGEHWTAEKHFYIEEVQGGAIASPATEYMRRGGDIDG